jgi:hypothetical protein
MAIGDGTRSVALIDRYLGRTPSTAACTTSQLMTIQGRRSAPDEVGRYGETRDPCSRPGAPAYGHPGATEAGRSKVAARPPRCREERSAWLCVSRTGSLGGAADPEPARSHERSPTCLTRCRCLLCSSCLRRAGALIDERCKPLAEPNEPNHVSQLMVKERAR